MFFFFQQPDEFLERFHAERERSEKIAQRTRALRGSTPPFDGPTRARLQQALADQPRGGQLAAERS
ncbi:MAG TPA: hypothetical protein VFJ00_05085 [Candidatus Limnocylindria bacterium]|nr:hypothetical protein [Candidatus Limnocylindria bacterium]